MTVPHATHLIVTPSAVTLPRQSRITRKPPRPVRQQQKSYTKQFDHRTLFYDVFRSGDDVVLSGPPLLNIKEALDSADFFTDVKGVATALLQDVDRTQRSRILDVPGAKLLTISSPHLNVSTEIGQDLTHLFADKKVIFTKSKNNRLDWIHDWALFHVETHGVNAVLLYDNGSTDYSPEDVLEALGRIPKLEVIVVVHWPFPFGPQGGSWDGLKNAPWDSDYCEYGIMEHARHRFLSGARAAINADIDELVVVKNGAAVFDILEASEAAVITYRGRWIETVGAPPDALLSFPDFRYFDQRRSPTTAKWVAAPKRGREATQWKTHQIAGVHMQSVDNIMHRHFMGINSDWKRARTHQVALDPSIHKLDEELSVALSSVFQSPQASSRSLEWGLSHPSAPQQSELLRGLQDQLTKIDFDNMKNIKFWFYRHNCLVMDFRVDGLPIAVDLVEESGQIAVKLMGRNDDARSRVRVIMEKTGVPERFGKYHLQSIPMAGDGTVAEGKVLRLLGTVDQRSSTIGPA